MKPVTLVPGLVVLVDNHGCTYRVKVEGIKDDGNFYGEYRLVKAPSGRKDRHVQGPGLFHPKNVRLAKRKTL